MRTERHQIVAALAAIGLSTTVLAGCTVSDQVVEEEEEYVKVVDSEGNTVYIEEDEYERSGGSGMFFIPFAMWNGSNHSALKAKSGFTGKTFATPPIMKVTPSGSSGIGTSRPATGGGFGG